MHKRTHKEFENRKMTTKRTKVTKVFTFFFVLFVGVNRFPVRDNLQERHMSGDYSRVGFDPKSDFSCGADAARTGAARFRLERTRGAARSPLARGDDRYYRPKHRAEGNAGGFPHSDRCRRLDDLAAAASTSMACWRRITARAPLEFDPCSPSRRGTLPMPYNEQPYFPNVECSGAGA